MNPFYADDRATLYRGDALAVLRELPDASVDAVITDPPYSSGGMMRGDRMQDTKSKYTGWTVGGRQMGRDWPEFTGDTRDQRSYLAWSSLWLSECLRIAKPGAVVLTFTDWRQLPVTSDAIQAGGWVWRGIVVWDKQHARPIKGRFRNHAEYVVWGSNGPMDAEANPVYPPCVFTVPPPKGDRQHMTQKPLRLMRGLMEIVPPGGTVLDPFAGSCTTGVAALIEGHSFIGIEMTEHYAAVGAARLRATAMQPGTAEQSDIFGELAP